MTDEIAPIETPADALPQVENAPPVESAQVDNAPPVDAINAPPVVEPPAFDVAPFAEQFCIPAERLKDCKTLDDVLSVVTASPYDHLVGGDESDDADPFQQPALATEVESLKQQLADLQSANQSLQSQLAAQLQQHAIELDRRVSAEIDSWQSARFGVGRNRNIGQLQETQKFRQALSKHVRGLVAAGEEIPTIEVLARRYRQFVDETTKPSTKKAAAPADREPLGTPGTQRSQRGGNDAGPRNIHQVTFQN